MFSKKLSSLILIGAIVLSFVSCSSEGSQPSASDTTAAAGTTAAAETTAAPVADNSDDIFVSAYPAFTVTSQSLHDGKWDEITAFENGNASPELTWEPVEGATTYVIYMIDMDTAYIIHWKSSDITETSLPEGWAPDSDYAGPRPQPGITHKYTVYVFALKNTVERAKGGVRSTSPKVQEFMDALDTDVNGNTGNIISVGRVSGYYSGK